MSYKYFKIAFLSFFILSTMTYISCKDDNDNPAPVENQLTFNLSYNVDGETLLFDTMKYTNEAGNKYSVTRLQYYISDIVFIRDDQNEYKKPIVHYTDARSKDKNKIVLKDIPRGTYTGLRFYVGLTPENNVVDGLPATQDNVNMIWPVMMGGGYHFMKLEGHFSNNGSSAGYAVHIGRDTALVAVEINENFSIGDDNIYGLSMNINEWYKNPNVYDLSDGNYTMGNIAAMVAIAANGKNAFSLIKN